MACIRLFLDKDVWILYLQATVEYIQVEEWSCDLEANVFMGQVTWTCIIPGSGSL